MKKKKKGERRAALRTNYGKKELWTEFIYHTGTGTDDRGL
jgi:hypothetical protein